MAHRLSKCSDFFALIAIRNSFWVGWKRIEIYYESIILLPIEDLTIFVFLSTLNPPVLRFYEPIPFSPIRVLSFDVPLLIGIPLLEANKFVQVGEHVDKDTAVGFPLEKIFEGELDAAIGFEEIDHLAYDVLEVKIKVALHIGQTLALLLIEVFQLIACDDSVPVQVHYFEPILNALHGRLVLNAQNEPHEITKAHLFLVLEFLHILGEDPLQCFSGEGVT